jgi:hypothetical protein
VRWVLAALVIVVGTGLLLFFAGRRQEPPVSSGALAPTVRTAPPPRAPVAPPAPPAAIGAVPESPGAQAGAAPTTAGAGPAELPKDPSARLRALEPLRREVFTGLAEHHWRVQRCGVADATIYVTLESLDGGVRIVDTRVEGTPSADPGGELDSARADPAVEDCVRSALVRNVVGAPSARPGRRWEMPFVPGALD